MGGQKSLFNADSGAIVDIEPVAISHWASPSDVEEIRKARGGESRYVAFRHSDQSLHLCDDAFAAVPFTLPRIFDFDIISFAKLEATESSEFGTLYAAVVGAVDMYNPGGAVLQRGPLTAQAGVLHLDLDVLGCGRFWVVIMLPVNSVMGLLTGRRNVIYADKPSDSIELGESQETEVAPPLKKTKTELLETPITISEVSVEAPTRAWDGAALRMAVVQLTLPPDTDILESHRRSKVHVSLHVDHINL